ncbi:precorrin-6x reductase [Rubidibacter lacunae KORDI 51-2]|uniref:Precorrin-6x reductase n=1 Tax=Rubidibacter lacunae KORDI 51-2 TaxID=582515 RepID=U5DKQ9_9CHRO|nr:cobalt-precorrin-6A reductase [Rubidibacter lacunae]ERN40310.1 precorrin-6x reductase [Rubidibacter lacunae KORDI 51-2]
MSESGRIWLIGGTSESAAIAREFLKLGVPFVVTVAAPEAARLYPPETQVRVGRLRFSQCEKFLRAEGTIAIVDASHPFAAGVSEMAIGAARMASLPYLRFERPAVALNGSERGINLANFNSLLAGNYLSGQRVLLTVGCRILPSFQPWQARSTLFARVLPRPESLDVALASGFTSDRLIALRPPVPLELELELCRAWAISLLVTKASGTAGGEAIARQAAAALEIPLVTIARPAVAYPQQTDAIATVVAFSRQAVVSSS